jgi:hypothetical protein
MGARVATLSFAGGRPTPIVWPKGAKNSPGLTYKKNGQSPGALRGLSSGHVGECKSHRGLFFRCAYHPLQRRLTQRVLLPPHYPVRVRATIATMPARKAGGSPSQASMMVAGPRIRIATPHPAAAHSAASTSRRIRRRTALESLGQAAIKAARSASSPGGNAPFSAPTAPDFAALGLGRFPKSLPPPPFAPSGSSPASATESPLSDPNLTPALTRPLWAHFAGIS